MPPKSLGDVLRWQFGGGRKRATWPDWAPSPHADTPPARVDGGKVRLSFVGHASWLIQTARPEHPGRSGVVGARLAVPLCRAEARTTIPASPSRRCRKIDVVLVSHGHYDHLDIATLSRLAETFAPRVITPLGNDVDDAARPIARSRPRRSTGTTASSSATASR